MAATESVLTWEMLAERAMNKADAAFNASADIISNAVSTYGPQAVDMMLMVVRIDNIQQLVYGGLILLMNIILIVWFIKIFRKHLREDCNGEWLAIEPMPSLLGCIPFAVVTVSMSFMTKTIFNVWVWAGVFAPEVWVAKQIVDKIAKMAQ